MAYYKTSSVEWANFPGRVVLGIILLALVCMPLKAVADKALRCPETNIKVIAQSSDESSMVCQKVRQTLAYSRSLGLNIEPELTLMLNQRTAENELGLAYGLFRPDEGRIMLVSVSDCEECMLGGKLFGLEMDQDLYLSMVVHELAHAIADANSQGAKIPRKYHEYIAYVFQLQLMQDKNRNRVITTNWMPAFESGEQITETYFLLAPEKFAVKSYLHFVSLSDQSASLRRMVSGKSP